MTFMLLMIFFFQCAVLNLFYNLTQKYVLYLPGKRCGCFCVMQSAAGLLNFHLIVNEVLLFIFVTQIQLMSQKHQFHFNGSSGGKPFASDWISY